MVLHKALHSIRSLLCTATNITPHERMFHHSRRATSGSSIPSWLIGADKVLLRKFNRTSKYDPLVEEVDLMKCYPGYARVRFQYGRDDTVSLRHLAPAAEHPELSENNLEIVAEPTVQDKQSNTDETSVTPSNKPYQSRLEQQQRVRPYILRNRDV